MKVYRDPLQKYDNPGGDCSWAGGQPKLYESKITGFLRVFKMLGVVSANVLVAGCSGIVTWVPGNPMTGGATLGPEIREEF